MIKIDFKLIKACISCMKILIVQNKEDSLFAVKLDHIEKINKVLPDADVTVDTSVDKHIDSDVVISGKLTENDFKKMKNLKWFHFTGAGVDFLREINLKSDIIITNSSGVHPIPIAEHVFAFMLMLERKINKAFRDQIERKWGKDYERFNVAELHGKTIGIIGMGRIGEKIAQLAKAFDMNVLGIVRTLREKDPHVDELYDYNGLDKVLSKSDHVVVCLPLTEDTNNLFDYEKFKKMKSSAYFINIGRGKIVKEDDLIKALKEKIIAGAGLDVFEQEPLPADSELWDMENVIITPHYSGWTPKYMDRVVDIFCENLKAYLENTKMPNLVNRKEGY